MLMRISIDTALSEDENRSKLKKVVLTGIGLKFETYRGGTQIIRETDYEDSTEFVRDMITTNLQMMVDQGFITYRKARAALEAVLGPPEPTRFTPGPLDRPPVTTEDEEDDPRA
jgi:pyrimidine operon attenuation protein/uracil phosphoribosyltransferase